MQGVIRMRFCLTRLVEKMSSRQSSVHIVTTLGMQNTVYFKYSYYILDILSDYVT
jgi:hypothetical protein